MQPSVDYLGYVNDKEGVHPMSRKVEPICEGSALSHVTELWSFLDNTQQYAKFIDGYSTLTNPFKVLLPWKLFYMEMRTRATTCLCKIKKAVGSSTTFSTLEHLISTEISMQC